MGVMDMQDRKVDVMTKQVLATPITRVFLQSVCCFAWWRLVRGKCAGSCSYSYSFTHSLVLLGAQAELIPN